jgi:hypothetical protein
MTYLIHSEIKENNFKALVQQWMSLAILLSYQSPLEANKFFGLAEDLASPGSMYGSTIGENLFLSVYGIMLICRI